MKVLFFMSHAGQARNFESTLRGLAERGHEVHMAYDRLDKKNLPGVSDLANALVAEYPQLTSGGHPRPAKEDWGWIASRLRLALDYMRYLEPEFKDAPKLRRRAEKFAPPKIARIARSMPRPGQSALRRSIRAAERAAPVSERLMRFISEHEPDVVLFTPLLEPGSVQVEYLRAANDLGVPTCLCVASWDNLTNKGLIHELPDGVTVWNEAQRDEAVALHAVPAERVHVTGAVAYDHWFGWKPSRSREQFAAAVGIDPARPFALYVGSSGFIAPDETGYLVEWVRELERGGLSDLQVLVRPHPANPLVNDDAELASLPSVTLYPADGANPTSVELRQDYFDSIYYSAAVAGVNTSAFLEAAILGRPVFTVLAERYRETQEGMLHFHHLLTAGGGLLHVSDSYEEHAAQLSAALAEPHPEEVVNERSRRFTAEFIRPYGLDEPATPRMLDAIEAIAAGKDAKSPNGQRRSVTGRVLARAARRSIARERQRRRRAKHRRDAKRAKTPKAGKPPKPEKSPKAEKVPKLEKPPKPEKPPKAEKPQQPAAPAAAVERKQRRSVSKMERRRTAVLPDVRGAVAELLARPSELELAEYAHRVISQHGEDGVTVEVFRRIGIEHHRGVEIGCGANGGNAGVLVAGLDFSVLLLDGNEELVEIARGLFEGLPAKAEQVWITTETVNDLLAQHGFDRDLDYLGLDLDGVDYWIWEALEVRSRFMICEYNPYFGASDAVTIPYAADFNRAARDESGGFRHPKAYWGASIAALERLGRRKGYRLVGSVPGSSNALFVRDDVDAALPAVTPAEAWRAPTKGKAAKPRGAARYNRIYNEGTQAYFAARGVSLVEVD